MDGNENHRGQGSPRRALEVNHARKHYGSTRALDGLSMVVGEGQWVGLLGPNGAGKSTLMGAIAGLLELDSGGIEIFGRANRDGGEIGYVPQEIALYPLLTTTENLRAFGRLHGVKCRDLRDRIDWALEWTGLEARTHTRTAELSGGMQRRLNIACGVLHNPRLVLLDEPTVGVDPQGRQRIWAMLEELRTSGTALVHSTHELHEMEAVCDRVLIVDRGRVLAEGTVTDLVRQTFGGHAHLELTLDRSAAGLLASNGYQVAGNRLEGTLSDIASELPAVLAKVQRAGLGVHDVHVEHPGLEAVFNHLTGGGKRA